MSSEEPNVIYWMNCKGKDLPVYFTSLTDMLNSLVNGNIGYRLSFNDFKLIMTEGFDIKAMLKEEFEEE